MPHWSRICVVPRAVFCSKKRLVLTPLISTFSGWFWVTADKTVNWCREDGSIATTQLGTLDHSTCRSAEDVGLQLADAKQISRAAARDVVNEQLERYCETVRPCPRCHRRRHLKEYRCRRFDTVFGRLGVRAPRFDSRTQKHKLAEDWGEGRVGRWPTGFVCVSNNLRDARSTMGDRSTRHPHRRSR
jgi:hypothetical protein